MSRVCFLDLVCGASGDMLLGALVDAGVELTVLQESLDQLGLRGLLLHAAPVQKGGIAATYVKVLAPRQHAHRHLPDIERILAASGLPDPVKARANEVFRELAAAESHVHRLPVDEVHFHEVGALDAIADVVGVVTGFDALGVDRVCCRALPVSHGTVRCEHGLLPVPAPAVVRLMDGLPTEPLDVDGETLTPTAAALLRVLVTDWQAAPPMTLISQGYGAGTRDFARPNVVRLLVGETATSGDTAEQEQTLVLLTTNIDDMNPEWLPALVESVLAAGARDAWLTPILMKKGRPAHTLSVLCDESLAEALREVVYTRSSSLGIRQESLRRFSLPRDVEPVTTPWGTVSIKVAQLPNGTTKAAPEYTDCRRLSEQHDVPLADVYEAAMAVWRSGHA